MIFLFLLNFFEIFALLEMERFGIGDTHVGAYLEQSRAFFDAVFCTSSSLKYFGILMVW